MARKQAAGSADSDIAAQVEAVLQEELYWFPVRHHSPAVARHVEAAIRARKPKVIFLEAPHEANDLLPHLLDKNTQPPVAIYSSYRDDDNVLGLAGVMSPAEDVPPRFASWYPLVGYSPEYLTLQTAQSIGAAVVFMDLPHHALLVPKTDRQLPEQDDDHLLFDSGFYHALALAAGYRTWPEAWDSLFEVRTFDDHEHFRRELATFCAAARATTPAERIRNDGTLLRERFMLHTVRDTLRQRHLTPSDAMVVCGGFHLFLDRLDAEPPPTPPAGTLYTTVVPYSFFRVSELSGYAAGNRAPQFYQTVWDLTRQGQADDVTIEHVVSVLKQARRAGEALSSADAIAATQHALMLARLRGRPAPILDDLHDALITCCCKGNPQEDGRLLLRALDQAGIGTRVGKVTPKLGRLPLVNDFYTQASDLDLGEAVHREGRVNLSLDKREPLAARRSALLHRLTFLEVPLAVLAETPTNHVGTLFQEKWVLGWSPAIESALVERSTYGDTVESAAVARLRERLAEEGGHAGNVAQRLVEAINMDLPDLVSRAEQVCGDAIDTDGRFLSLSQALGHLAILERYAAHRQLRQEAVVALLERCFDRACFALAGAIALPDDQHADLMTALLTLGELVQRGRQGLDRALFVEQVRQASRDSPIPYLRGAFLGTLVELRDEPPDKLAAEVSGLARAPVEQMVTAGDFLAGVLAVSRTSILLGADALVGAIDELLRAAEWPPFLTLLPRLRAAFEQLHERQRDAIAQRVATRYGLAKAEEVRELRTSVGAATRIARIDQQVAQIMQRWSFG